MSAEDISIGGEDGERPLLWALYGQFILSQTRYNLSAEFIDSTD